jgi:hypothetical protein
MASKSVAYTGTKCNWMDNSAVERISKTAKRAIEVADLEFRAINRLG